MVMTRSVALGVLLAASLLASGVLWRRIWAGELAWYWKVGHALFAAIPVLGPTLYIFLDPPPAHPPERQMKPFPKGTKVIPSFAPLTHVFARLFGRRDRRRK